LQRQPWPYVIKGEAPLVAPAGARHPTRAIRRGGVLCKSEGIVDQVDSERIIVRVESDHSGVLSAKWARTLYQLISSSARKPEHCTARKPLVRRR